MSWRSLFASLWLLVCSIGAHAQPAAGRWSSQFPLPPGFNGAVHAMGQIGWGGDLYAAGEFTQISGVPTHGIARWNGSAWSNVKGGLTHTNNFCAVFAMASDLTNLYVGGRFTHAGNVPAANIAKWTGAEWQPLGEGINEKAPHANYPIAVTCLLVQGTNLYVGGMFARAGNVPAYNIARWDGQTWHAMDKGLYVPDSSDPGSPPVGEVWAIAGNGESVLAGGLFLKAGEIGATNLAVWTGSAWKNRGYTSGGPTWLAAGAELSGRVTAVAYQQDDMFIAGDFTTVGPEPFIGSISANAARFRVLPGPSRWNPIRVDGSIARFSRYNDQVYFLGNFKSVEGVRATNIAKFQNGSHTAVNFSTPEGQAPFAAYPYGDQVVVGGSFSVANGRSAGNIAAIGNEGLITFGAKPGNSLSDAPTALATDGTNLFVAGYFTSAGTNQTAGLAKWDGTNWSNPATILKQLPSLSRVAVIDSHIFVSSYSPQPEFPGSIGRWDGQKWEPIPHPDGNVYDVRALEVVGKMLYASLGFFDGQTGFQTLSRWDGNSWLNLTPTNHLYYQEILGAQGTNLLVLRGLTEEALTLSKWNGTELVQIGEPLPLREPQALTASASKIFAAGRFGDLPGNVAIFQWDGLSWSRLPLDFEADGGPINALAATANRLFIGGAFRSINGVAVNSIADWSNNSIHPLDAGLSLRGGHAGVSSLRLVGKTLYASGYFDNAGPFESGNVAAWSVAPYIQLRSLPGSIEISGDSAQLEIESADSLNEWSHLADINFTGQTQVVQDHHVSSPARFYRAKIIEP